MWSAAKSHWKWALTILAVISLVINIIAFFPGYLSNDSISHLRQALGKQPVVDLTPPAMTAVWKSLIIVTGQVSSMLWFQLLMLWSALLTLALYVFQQTRSRKLSLLPLLIGGLPFVANISGVIWRDNQMTFALLLAVALILYSSLLRGVWRKLALGVALGFTVYGCLVRYNAAVAIVPIVFWIVLESGITKKLQIKILASAGVMVAIVAAFFVVNAAMNTQQTHPQSALMIDDVINITDGRQTSTLSEPLRKVIETTSKCSKAKNSPINNFWVCANDSDRNVLQYDHYEELSAYWLASIVGNPVEYGLYKLEMYMNFLFPPADYKFIWQEGIVPNDENQQVAFPRLGNINEIFVNNFGYKYFSFLYEPWFWLAVSLYGLLASRRLKLHKTAVRVLTISSITYLLAYLPTGATVDYRYIYWPVLACLVSACLAIIDKRDDFARFRRRLFAKV